MGLGLLLALACAAADKTSPDKSRSSAKKSPSWIWLDDKPRDNQTVYFRKEFAIAHPVAAVKLQATCHNALTLFIDGKKVLEHSEWESPVVKDVTEHFVTSANKTGEAKHLVAVQAHNSTGPAGLVVRLVIAGRDNKTLALHPAPSWQPA